MINFENRIGTRIGDNTSLHMYVIIYEVNTRKNRIRGHNGSPCFVADTIYRAILPFRHVIGAFFVKAGLSRFCCHECCDRKRRLLFENAEQPAFFLVRLALHVKQLVSRFGNCLLQLFAVKRSLGDYDSLALRVRRCHFFHIKLASDAVIHMRFAHAAHHTVDFQSCFDHRFVLLIFIQHP